MKRLPAKASTLIRLAVADLEEVEKNPVYRVDMSTWHGPVHNRRGKCLVCFAGAVMACSLEIDPTCAVEPDVFDSATRRKMLALDNFRIGSIETALELLDVPWRKRNLFPRAMSVAPYKAKPEYFKADMRDLATRLEKVGL